MTKDRDNARIVGVAAGATHSLAILDDGSLVSWGSNLQAQLGRRFPAPVRQPGRVAGLPPVREAVGDLARTVAVCMDGSAWYWGGRWSWDPRSIDEDRTFEPLRIDAPGSVISASTNNGASRGVITLVLADGNVAMVHGDVLRRASEEALVAERIPRLEAIEQVTVVESRDSMPSHVLLALASDGAVRELDLSREQGDGRKRSPRPRQVPELRDIVEITSSCCHVLALRSYGRVAARGWGRYGQLGSGSSFDLGEFVEIHDLPDVVAVAAGRMHSLAVDREGRIWAWGDNEHGQLGQHDDRSGAVPVQVPCNSQVISVAAGSEHSLALTNEGKVLAWGSNEYGPVGVGATSVRLPTERVDSVDGASRISAGSFISVAVTADSRTYAWGLQARGGGGEKQCSDSLRKLFGDGRSSVDSLGTAGRNVVVVREDGSADLWGTGPFADGGVVMSDSPVSHRIDDLRDLRTCTGTDGSFFAIKHDGSVWAWGYEHHGRLGDGTEKPQGRPVRLESLPPITEVAAACMHTLAVDLHGQAWSWGDNGSSALGDGSRYERAVPGRIPGLDEVRSVAAGGDWHEHGHSLALLRDGTVWGWGNNTWGQAGADGATELARPKRIDELPDIIAISAGDRHSLALDAHGHVFAWGANDKGQLGTRSTTLGATPRPERVDGLAGMMAIAAGTVHSLALDRSGAVFAWGSSRGASTGDASDYRVARPLAIDLAFT